MAKQGYKANMRWEPGVLEKKFEGGKALVPCELEHALTKATVEALGDLLHVWNLDPPFDIGSRLGETRTATVGVNEVS